MAKRKTGVDVFGTADFELALPCDKTSGKPLWWSLGVVDGEHCYIVRPFPNLSFGIIVRSSVGADGTSRGCGEDSIRAQIVKLNPPAVVGGQFTYERYGGKSQRWVTRMPGWGERMTDVLRKLSNQIQWLQPCPACRAILVPFTSRKKESPVKGKGFVRCESAKCYNEAENRSATFFLTDDDDKEPIPPGDTFKPKAPAPTNGTAPMPQTTQPARPEPIACPKCGKCALMPSIKAGTAGQYHCFRRLGGCQYTGPLDAVQANTPQDNDQPTPADYYKLREMLVAALEYLDDANSDLPFGQVYHRGGTPVANLKQWLRSEG